MISKDLLLTVFNYLANGAVQPETSTTKTTTTLAPYQIVVIMKNNNVTVSRTTVTSINVNDIIIANQEEKITIRYSGTDASPFTYTTDKIEIWASTQTALLYKIADIQLNQPLSKTEHDYLNVEYEISITAGANYIETGTLSQYTKVVTFRTPVAPILYFFGLFLVPSWNKVLKQNPTFPQSQLINYINTSTFQGINAMYVENDQITILSKLVGFGKSQVNFVINGQVNSSYSNAPVYIGITTPDGLLVIAYGYFDETINQYVSMKISAIYGNATVVNKSETQTTGDIL